MTTNSKEVKAEVLVQTLVAWDGSALPDYPTTKPQVIIKRFKFPAHGVTAWHAHPVINAGIVLSGEITIVCRNGEEHTFHSGEPVVELCNAIHRGENRGDTDAELLMFYTSTPSAEINIPE